VIYSTMVEKSYVGWVEIDAKGTLKYWEKAKNNLGFAIDVYDQDDKILDARQHFHLQDCEGGKSVVSNVYINNFLLNLHTLFAKTNKQKTTMNARKIFSIAMRKRASN
jgi:hypothetical protein